MTRTLTSASSTRDTTTAQHHPWNRRVGMLGAVALTAGFSLIAVTPSTARAAHPVAPLDLGLVETFGILTPGAVGNAANVAGMDPTMIRGDLGAGGAVTGFAEGWGVVTGMTYDTDPDGIAPMMADLREAYDDAWARPDAIELPASFAGMNFTHGVYSTAAAAGTAASTSFTIDGEGNPDSVFIFRVGGALDFGASTTITLVGGAQAKNVFWVTGGAGGLGAPTEFVGTLIATTAITAGTGSTVNGRLTSLGGAVTMTATQLYSAPPTVSIDGGVDTAYTTTSTPIITGVTSARAPMTVIISIDGVDQTPVLTPAADGTWSFQSGLLANGPHTIRARSVDSVGNIGSDTQILTVDTTLPVVDIDGGTSAATNDLSPTISGTTDIAAGRSVTVTLTRTSPAQTLTYTTLVQADLTWNITPNALDAGEWRVVAEVTDPAGNPNSATQTLTVDATAPAAAITSPALTNDPTPTISGTTETGATVAVSINGIAVGDVVQGENWSATTTVTLGHGDHNVMVTATDTVGNSTVLTQTLTVDLVAPIVTINPGPAASSSDATPTIAGTTDVAVGATVNVSIDGGAPLTALVQADGWNVTPSADLATGEHTIVATVTDPAGNIGTATQTMTIDTTGPTVTIDGGPTRSTADRTPTITGSSFDVPAGSPVSVQVAGQTMNATIAGDGTFRVTAAAITPNDTYFVFVTVIDAAGNKGSANQSLTINAIPPTVTFTNGSTASTNDPTPLIAGTSNAAVGSRVVVTVDGQTLNATVQPGGSWTVNAAALATGSFEVVASITDQDGNIGTATQTLEVDSTTPTTLLIAGGATVATNDDTPTISGTTDAADGRVITVTVGTQTLTVSALAGTWAVTATHLDDGTYTVTAAVSDVGGNPGSATQTLTIDTVAPAVVIGGGEPAVQTTDPTPDISGSGATPGSDVTVTIAGQTMTTTVASDGTWSVTPAKALPAGDNTATVTIVDPAGNTGTGTQTITVTPVPPTSTTPPATTTPPAAEYTSVGPKRVFDTRPGASSNALRTVAKQQVGGGYELRVMMTDLAGFVPAGGVGAVSLNVTSTGSSAAGFITVYACGTREEVSSVNYAAGRTVANAVISPVATDGTVCFYALNPTHIIVDINGWFAAGEAFNAVGPKRVFDTRPGASPSALRAVPKSKLAAGTMMEVRLTDLAGYVPAGGVGSVSLNVVVANTEGPGFITVYSCGTLEEVSSVNYVAGQVVANAVIAPVSANGTVCFYSLATVDLIVDINGWIEAGSSFHGVAPARVLDTRPGASSNALRSVSKTKIGGGHVLTVEVSDLPGYTPANGVRAVSLNVTAVGTEGPGFITVFPCGTMEEVSSLNYDTADQVVANAVLAPVSAAGTICLFSYARTHVVVDINGWID